MRYKQFFQIRDSHDFQPILSYFHLKVPSRVQNWGPILIDIRDNVGEFTLASQHLHHSLTDAILPYPPAF